MAPEEVEQPKPQRCRRCEAVFYLVRGPKGKFIPVQKVTQLYKAQRTADGFELVKTGQGLYYISHFQTCPYAHEFSQRQKKE
jgi:hypothetical protein